MSDGGFIPIRTDRLVLRRFAARDAGAFQAYALLAEEWSGRHAA